jgi:hypothetical protein
MVHQRPSDERVAQAKLELQRTHGLTDFELIGKGNYGYVYKARMRNGEKVVVKMAYDSHEDFERRTRVIERLLVASEHSVDDRQYYTTNGIEYSAKVPGEDDGRPLVFCFMEALEGKDMLQHLEAHGRGMEFGELMKLIYRLAAAVHAFSSASIMLSDMKLENVFVHGARPDMFVTMIDYIESPTGCAVDRPCTDRVPRTKTYYELDRAKDETLASDVWRLALLVLDMLHVVVEAKGGSGARNFPAELIADGVDDGAARRDDAQRDALADTLRGCREVFGDVYDAELRTLRDVLALMLQADVRRRVDIAEVHKRLRKLFARAPTLHYDRRIARAVRALLAQTRRTSARASRRTPRKTHTQKQKQKGRTGSSRRRKS